MILVLAGLIVASVGGVGLAGWLARRRTDSAPSETPPVTHSDGNARDPSSPDRERSSRTTTHLEGFPCQLGDVIVRDTGEEAWLAGGLLFSESRFVAALFLAPEARRDCAIYTRPLPFEGIFWLEPLDAGAVIVGAELPSSVEHGGTRFERARRLPLHVIRAGTGAPQVASPVVLAEYASLGAERLIVIRDSVGTALAFCGVALEPHAYEVIRARRLA